jgi:hypothetical protein
MSGRIRFMDGFILNGSSGSRFKKLLAFRTPPSFNSDEKMQLRFIAKTDPEDPTFVQPHQSKCGDWGEGKKQGKVTQNI